MKRYMIPALAMMLGAQGAMALGLGEINQQSGLGQPFKAEIPLEDARMWSADQIKVAVSGQPAPIVREVDVKVERSRRGSFVLLESRQPVTEPFLDLTVNVAWPDGSLQRDYQLLFDPVKTN